MLAVSLSFLTPKGGYLALAVGLPLLGLLAASVRDARGRARLGLAAPPADRTGVALSLVPLLLGLAASQPALEQRTRQHFRTDAQALFVVDVSGSMAAASGPRAPTRLAQAEAAAIRLRNSIPEIPSGIATLTTQLLPELLPTTDAATFDTTLQRVIGIEQPPPPILSYGTLGTSFDPLAFVRSEGYYAPTAKHRVLVLLTDGETAPYDPQATATALTSPSNAYPLSGLQTETDWPVSLVIVRVGGASDHIYNPNGSVDAAFRAVPHADDLVANLAKLASGAAYTPASLGGASGRLRRALGRGHEITRGTHTTTVGLARYLALGALLAAAFVVWRRNVAT